MKFSVRWYVVGSSLATITTVLLNEELTPFKWFAILLAGLMCATDTEE